MRFAACRIQRWLASIETKDSYGQTTMSIVNKGLFLNGSSLKLISWYRDILIYK